MMKITRSIAAAAALLFAISLPASAELQAGDAAPNFELMGSDGKMHRLSDYKGEQAVVLAFFPKAFTGG